MNTNIGHATDAGAFALTVAALMGWLPAATAILSFVYVCIRISETATVHLLLKRLRRWLFD